MCLYGYNWNKKKLWKRQKWKKMPQSISFLFEDEATQFLQKKKLKRIYLAFFSLLFLNKSRAVFFHGANRTLIDFANFLNACPSYPQKCVLNGEHWL